MFFVEHLVFQIFIKAAFLYRTQVKLVREWIDLHADELEKDWQLAQAGKEILKIEP